MHISHIMATASAAKDQPP